MRVTSISIMEICKFLFLKYVDIIRSISVYCFHVSFGNDQLNYNPFKILMSAPRTHTAVTFGQTVQTPLVAILAYVIQGSQATDSHAVVRLIYKLTFKQYMFTMDSDLFIVKSCIHTFRCKLLPTLCLFLLQEIEWRPSELMVDICQSKGERPVSYFQI